MDSWTFFLTTNFVFSVLRLLTKGQLISKWFFGVIDFLQKTNERIRLYYYDTSGQLVFVCFLEKIEGTKKTITKLSDLYSKH